MENTIEVGIKVVSYEDGVIQFSNGYELRVAKPRKPKGKTVEVFAFTGMRLGDLEVTKETKSLIEVVRGDGKTLVFDKNTGLQKNCKNARFANRIKLA